MKLRVQQGDLLNGEIADADDITYVVIFSNEGDPIMVVEQVGRDHIQATKVNEPAFPAILERLGVNVTRAVR